ncbi:hypothetical protein PNOK_0791100 [Pyrrhoderma noxium]|uniref:Uncharacterized protein n=1 Tax=Pyrrhoderma noxium TaxID=2282107 RepID=A0A286U9M7_9AGAM|nr:hypothetical protein PNOK_0791100 [Pyrrhoderma noxium]
MNDPRSMMIGWGALLFAAGSGYYFARKDLNERKREQMKQGLRGPPMDWREKVDRDTANPESQANGSNPDASHNILSQVSASSDTGKIESGSSSVQSTTKK